VKANDLTQFQLAGLILQTIYKGKGDPQDPNNHRGIALKEMSAKVMSIIIAKRLQKGFREINPITQFGYIGCQEVLHIIKRALLLRHQHGIESYADFINLVKAFDTVNHKLMCQILIKYGLPPKLVATISKLYKDCNIKINIGKTFTELSYSTGVQQGDNTLPLLFLLIIQAFLETLRMPSQSNSLTSQKTKTETSKHARADSLAKIHQPKGRLLNFRTPLLLMKASSCFRTYKSSKTPLNNRIATS
jgi:hypothetical protein